jgi:hypothetical protein
VTTGRSPSQLRLATITSSSGRSQDCHRQIGVDQKGGAVGKPEAVDGNQIQPRLPQALEFLLQGSLRPSKISHRA